MKGTSLDGFTIFSDHGRVVRPFIGHFVATSFHGEVGVVIFRFRGGSSVRGEASWTYRATGSSAFGRVFWN